MIQTSETHSARSIRTAISRVHAITAGLDAVASTLEEHGIETVEIKFQAALTRALKDLNRWSAAAQDAVTEKLDEIGAFSAGQAKKRAPTKRRRGTQ